MTGAQISARPARTSARVSAIPDADGLLWAVCKEFAIALVLLTRWGSAGAAGMQVHGITVRDAIETTRPLNGVVVSPNARRYVSILIRGDTTRDGIWADVLSGSLDSLQEVQSSKVVASLFSTAESSIQKNPITIGRYNQVRWVGATDVAFLWDDQYGVSQVVSVNVSSGRVTYLTNHATNVQTFDVSAQREVLYTALSYPEALESASRWKSGFAVDNADAWSLLAGHAGRIGWGEYKRYLVLPGSHVGQVDIQSSHEGVDQEPYALLKFSPDGRHAVSDGVPAIIPQSWKQYTDPSLMQFVRYSEALDGAGTSRIHQLFVTDVPQRRSAPLWDAPSLPWKVSGVWWSPDSRELLVAPAFTPTRRSSAQGLAGKAAAVVDINSGEFAELRLPRSDADIRAAGWLDGSTTYVDTSRGRFCYRRVAAQWRLWGSDACDLQLASPPQGVAVRYVQDVEHAPKLVGVDERTAQTVLVRDLNPRLGAQIALGHIESVVWKDDSAWSWRGRLYFPVHYRPGRRYPLVIQTHGVPSDGEFSLYGYAEPGMNVGLGPGISIFSAEPLASRDIVVLQMSEIDTSAHTDVVSTSREAETYERAFESAVRYLAGRGIVDPARVGLSGWSRTGWHVEFALTHSRFPYAAALVSDNMDASYVQGSLNGSGIVGLDEALAQYNGAVGYGAGLKTWLDSAPGFNADKIQVPLRLQVEAGRELILGPWELFNALRLQKKPVEYYIIPDIDHGSHLIQKPSQCLASQEGAVDWFDFWLNGHEDNTPSKAEQYVRWAKLKELNDSELALRGSRYNPIVGR